ncbi:multiprotein-bridging factor 1 family protein [Jannaschia sp. 2305UL9-9]|uniref:helix-turn-helix domain-containing protein n=1 Tax=Jannaschia sp. 2305UL9-9 TaxID=3121638 RepID=UPI0035292654
MAIDTQAVSSPDPESVAFSRRLSDARRAAGLSQADLAHRIGVKARTVRAWEKGEVAPRANRLSILCGLLNVSLVWLMTGRDPAQTPPVALSSDAELLADLSELRRNAADLGDRLAYLEERLRSRMEDPA